MKRWMVSLLVMNLLVLPGAFAKDDKQSAKEKELLEKRMKVEEKKKALNGSEWQVTVKPQDAKEKESQDTLSFQNNQVSSKNLSKRGFGATNYTVSIQDDAGNVAIWETMKTGKEGVVFMRGEWTPEKMSGAITEQLKDSKDAVINKEYSFSSSSTKAVEPTTTGKEEEEEKKVSGVAPALKA